MYEETDLPDTNTAFLKSKSSKKRLTNIVRMYTILKTPDMVSFSQFMRVNAHSPEPYQFALDI